MYVDKTCFLRPSHAKIRAGGPDSLSIIHYRIFEDKNVAKLVKS